MGSMLNISIPLWTCARLWNSSCGGPWSQRRQLPLPHFSPQSGVLDSSMPQRSGGGWSYCKGEAVEASQAAPFVLVLESTVRSKRPNSSGACESFDKYFSLRVFPLSKRGCMQRWHMHKLVATDVCFAGTCHVWQSGPGVSMRLESKHCCLLINKPYQSASNCSVRRLARPAWYQGRKIMLLSVLANSWRQIKAETVLM